MFQLMMLKAVILIGGPQKGTRFRPLSFDLPKPLFPVAGYPMLQHLIEACAAVEGMKVSPLFIIQSAQSVLYHRGMKYSANAIDID